MKVIPVLLVFLLIGEAKAEITDNKEIAGAWKTTFADGNTGILVITEKHYSVAIFKEDPAVFVATHGGVLNRTRYQTTVTFEYNTMDESLIGKTISAVLHLSGGKLYVEGDTWERIDDGSPGKLAGAWLITGIEREGEMREIVPGARRTMKILSGKYFQWIAYNVETKEFFGTGGGTYTSKEGKYIEEIGFFSRDNSRVGASLEFDYELKDGDWHQRGKSSKGEPKYEIWSQRHKTGI